MTGFPTQPNSPTRQARRGLSVIEVLTSMVVALIGVAGVLVLIPFAVRQAELGLDIDDANRLARNAIASFQIGEHDRLDTTTGGPAWFDATDTQVGGAPEVYAIDPLGVTLDGATAFPYSPVNPVPTTFTAVNLSTYDPASALSAVAPLNPFPMTSATARRFCQTTDDLQFTSPDDDLNGPDQVYDFDGTANVRRQSRGEMSWMSIAVPVKDDYTSDLAPVATPPLDGTGATRDVHRGWKFRQHILVFKNRVVTSANMVMPTAEVLTPAAGTAMRSGSTIELDATAVTDVRKNDWLMLYNEDATIQAVDPGFETQVGFFRVVGTGIDAATGNVKVTLDGPDFGMNGTTTAVHLVQFDNLAFTAGRFERAGYVVNVYERTFRLRENTNWNK